MNYNKDDKKEMYGLLHSGRWDSLVFNLEADSETALENTRLLIQDSSIRVKINIKTDMDNDSRLSLPEIVCEDGKKAKVDIATYPKTGIFKKPIELKFALKSDISEIRLPSLNRERDKSTKSLLWLPKNTIITIYDFMRYEDGAHIRNVGELRQFCEEEYHLDKSLEADKRNEIADYSPF